jgi:hypothetical protein
MTSYRHNHYAPEWYQRRFMLPGQHKYYRLDLKPDVVDTGEVRYTRNDMHHWGPDSVFAQDDLYTTQWGGIPNTEIEQFFFGKLDNNAPAAVEFFSTFDQLKVDERAFKLFLTNSLQKLRTPKGLAAFAGMAKSHNRNATLLLLQRLQN